MSSTARHPLQHNACWLSRFVSMQDRFVSHLICMCLQKVLSHHHDLHLCAFDPVHFWDRLGCTCDPLTLMTVKARLSVNDGVRLPWLVASGLLHKLDSSLQSGAPMQ